MKKFNILMDSIAKEKKTASIQEHVERSIAIIGYMEFKNTKLYIENKNDKIFQKYVYNALNL